MKKFVSSIMAIVMIAAAMCVNVSATATYQYADKTQEKGVKLTSALYVYYNDNPEYVDVMGLTRIDTYASPDYTKFTLRNKVEYSYGDRLEDALLKSTSNSLTVSSASANSNYRTDQCGFRGDVTAVKFLFGYQYATAVSGGVTILSAPKNTNGDASAYSLRDMVEMEKIMR